MRCPRSMTSGSKGCWSTARRSGRKFFSPIFAPILSAIRSPPPPAKLNSFPPPSPGLAIANVLAIRGGMNREAARQRQEAARWPLHLLSSQPRARLHSQYDHGSVSRATKIQGREPLWMHPSDAQARDIREGSVVKVYNDRGAILAGVHLSEQILPGVVQMSTGAWYDPLDPNEKGTLDKHGNPNVLTEDRGSSRLGQGCSAQSCWVEIAPWREELPPITAFDPPKFIEV